jgi:two-component system sensor histidine kinase/response regulator
MLLLLEARMEGDHHQEQTADPIRLRTASRQLNGNSDGEDLSVLNAKLARENAQLTRERDLLRVVIDSLPDFIFVKDQESRFLINNLAHARFLGADHPVEVAGKIDFDCFPKEFAEKYFADEQIVMQSGKPLSRVESVVDNTTKEIRWLQTTKVPRRDEDGKIIGLIGISRDITALKRAEEASRKELEHRTAQLSQERLLLRTLIDNLPDAIYSKDIAGRKTLANPADLKNLPCKMEAEALGKDDFDMFPREIAEKFWADDQKVIQGGSVINREEYFFNEEGQKCWLLTSKLPLRDQSGKIVGLVGIGRNITEQKQAETMLAYEQQLFQQLLETLPDNIYFKDRESRFVRVSRSKAKATMQTVRRSYRAAHPDLPPNQWPAHLADLKSFSEWLIGKTDFDTYSETHALSAREDEKEIIRTGQPMVGKLQKTEVANGETLWWLSTKMPWRDKEGEIIGTFGTSLDVTRLKQTEESLERERALLRTLIDRIPDAIYIKDRAGRFILNNPTHAKRRGLKTPSEMIGKTDFDFFPKEVAEQFFADEQKIIETGAPLINQEQFTGMSDNGEKRWVVVSKALWRDDQGNVLGTLGITRDIHEFKMAQEALQASEEKLRESAARLERSNRELQDFAYVASHDLQEPLRKIVVFGERLKEKAADRLEPETLDYLQRMQKAASRMQNLINDLLTFSRVTTKAHPYAPVDLGSIAREVMDDLESRIETTKGRVELGDLPVIDAEPVQMRQLFQNLIGNALKFRRPEAPPVVKIEAKIYSGVLPQAAPDSPQQKLCELTVSDNGIGFEEKYLDRIFNVFQRLHTRNEYEGTGMGLAIARKIVLYHGGTITAKSAPDQGAKFIVTLPAVQAKPHTNGKSGQ